MSISTLYKYHLHKYILLATEVETFIAKFPMAEVLTCPEDKLSECPTEILEKIFQYNRLEVLFWSTRRCVMLERDQSSGTSPW